MLQYREKAIEKTGPCTLGELGIHPNFSYLTLFSITNIHKEFTWNILWFLWYVLMKFTIAIEFPIPNMIKWLKQIKARPYSL